jgi:hypothetical protein
MFYSQLEDKAFELGRKMASDGYRFDENPYVQVSPRLETLWNQGHAGSRALAGLAQNIERACARIQLEFPSLPAGDEKPQQDAEETFELQLIAA